MKSTRRQFTKPIKIALLCLNIFIAVVYMLSAYAEINPKIKDEIFMKAEPFNTEKTIFVGHTPTLEGVPFISEKYHLVD